MTDEEVHETYLRYRSGEYLGMGWMAIHQDKEEGGRRSVVVSKEGRFWMIHDYHEPTGGVYVTEVDQVITAEYFVKGTKYKLS